MDNKPTINRLVKTIAQRHGINPALVRAIVSVESAGDTWASRFEPGWRWYLNPKKWARFTRRSKATEVVHQATSWGLMQIMGTVAREEGYTGSLPALCIPERGLEYGCRKLRKLIKKHDTLSQALSAWNTGRPNTKVGKKYAEKVIERMDGWIER